MSDPAPKRQTCQVCGGDNYHFMGYCVPCIEREIALKDSDATATKNAKKVEDRVLCKPGTAGYEKNKPLADQLGTEPMVVLYIKNKHRGETRSKPGQERSRQEAAKRELARRELARRHLLPFILKFQPDYQAGWVHKDICERLERFHRAVQNKESPRLMLFMPPRHGKSMIASQYFPAWAFGQDSRLEMIAASYAQSLQLDFSRKIQDLLRDPEYKELFPDTRILKDNESVERWALGDERYRRQRGGYLAAGVGGPITGRGANILIIDDPVKNRQEADSETSRKTVKDWFSSTAYTRLAPGGGILIIQCMTGDTPVLMSDGTTRRLDALRVGDLVASYDSGRLVTSKVLNWAHMGPDRVYRITTRSGHTVRANARHPFLVDSEGAPAWIRTKDLRVGHRIVAAKGNGACGKALSAPGKGVEHQQSAGATAIHTTTRRSGPVATALHRLTHVLGGVLTSSIAMASNWMSTTGFSQPRMAFAPSANGRRRTAPQATGGASFVSTTATLLARSVDCFVTTATSLLGTYRQKQWPLLLPATSDFTLDEIASIEEDGFEEVFDVQVADTENFIANGLVSHNTRWHDDDLSGFILNELRHAEKQFKETGEWPEDYDRWEVVSYPALATDDERFRKRGDALHPARYDEKALQRIKRTLSPRDWAALYQQSPVAEEGAYFTKNMVRFYDEVPPGLYIVCAGDLAISKATSADWSVFMVAGLDIYDNIYFLDERRGRWGADELCDQLIDIHRTWAPKQYGLEKGQISMTLLPHLERRLRDAGIKDMAIEQLPVANRGDKQARARPLQGRMSRGQVYYPRGALWTDDHINELLRFPSGVHDDRVDGDAWIAHMLAAVKHPGAGRAERQRTKTLQDKLRSMARKLNGASSASPMAA
jgi:predicted phage terminase large subunit-like protein